MCQTASAAVLFAAVVPCLAVIHVAGVPHGRVEGQEDGVGHVAEVEAVATAPVAAAGAGAEGPSGDIFERLASARPKAGE